MRISLPAPSTRFLAAAAMLLACLAVTPHLFAGANPNGGDKTRGADLFAVSGCTYCHGKAGVGGGVGPDLQLVRKRRNRDQIVKQITEGGKGMPPFGAQFTPDQIDDLVAFLEAKRKVIVVAKPAASTAAPNAAN